MTKHDDDATPPIMIKPASAAAMLSISPRTLWSLTKRGAIPSRRIGRSIRYCPDELVAWIAADCPTDAGSARCTENGVK